MYNGIGLLTPRGSGTSGHVQTNKFNLRGRPQQRILEDRSSLKGPEQKQANQAILDHTRKRDIELKLAELADSLEEQGYSPEEIEKEVLHMREEMEKEGAALAAKPDNKPLTETHELAERKQQELATLRAAWGLGEEVVEGQAFNRELQEQRRQDKIAEREAVEKERAAKKCADEKRRAKEAKAAKKAARRADKDARNAAKAEAVRAAQLKQEGERRVEELQEARARRRAAAERPAATPTPPRDLGTPGDRGTRRDRGESRDAAPSRRRPREDDGRGDYDYAPPERRHRHDAGPSGAPLAPDEAAAAADRWEPRPATPDGENLEEPEAFEETTHEPVAAEAPQEAPGGIMFFHTLGMLAHVSEQYDLRDAQFVGASSSALVATLNACGVKPQDAIERARELADEAHLFQRRLGLVGIWGGLIRTWLHDLLPPDAAARCSGRVSLMLTSVSEGLRRVYVDRFADKDDLVEACMAAVHVPIFLDWRMAASFRGGPFMDGSVPLSALKWQQRQLMGGCPGVTLLDHSSDPELQTNLLKAGSLQGYDDAVRVYERGRAYSRELDTRGSFSHLPNKPEGA
ncbi:hypothetical protein WJX81_005452 [Elliptochloris bilobata]|uniref:Patatin n=1 Tax=Elliptochloris bilobata TaxID=381761 RepID=A0AAW1QK90_9CHLO